jgi:hypothetical protein
MLAEAGRPPLPLTPHSLRQIRVRAADARGAGAVRDGAGRPLLSGADAGGVREFMRRSEGEKERLSALVDGGPLPSVSARSGAEAAQAGVSAEAGDPHLNDESPAGAGLS